MICAQARVRQYPLVLLAGPSQPELSSVPDDRKCNITDKNLRNAPLQSPEFAQDWAMYRDLL